MNPKRLIFHELDLVKNELGIDALFTNQQRKDICSVAYAIAQQDRHVWLEESEKEARMLATRWGWYVDRCVTEESLLLNNVLTAQVTKLYEVAAVLETISTQYDRQAEIITGVIATLTQCHRPDYNG